MAPRPGGYAIKAPCQLNTSGLVAKLSTGQLSLDKGTFLENIVH